MNVKILVGNYIKTESATRWSVGINMTASQHIFLAIVQLAPCRLVLAHSGDSVDRAENSKAYVRAVWRIAGALDERQDNGQ